MRPIAAAGSLALPLVLLAVASLPGATIDVPGDAPTIQGGIDLAFPGDVVIVGPGVYPETIDFSGKAIAVRSSDGPATTIIDGQWSGPVVTFVNAEGPASVLEGFTIRNGQISSFDFDAGGGGILVDGASPTIRGNVIRDCIGLWNGGGILCVDSNASIERNEFIDNTFFAAIADAPYGSGGGIHVRGGAVTIVGNRFQGNTGFLRGGAICLEDTQGSVITTATCIGNSSGHGGAIAVIGTSNVTLDNLLLVGNQATGHVSIIGVSEGRGGAIHVGGLSVAQVRSATIVGNACLDGSALGTGGGVLSDSLLTIPTTVASSILRGNVAPIDSQSGGAVFVAWSDIEGGAPGVGNFDADPLFVAGPDGAHYLSHLAAGQGADSPCIDAGDPAAPPLPGTTTRTDSAADTGTIDVGFHFPLDDAPFRRGDCNGDGTTNIADAIFLLSTLFPVGGPPPSIGCDDACDANDDGTRNIADAVAILGALFGGMPMPPPTGTCGPDPTPDPYGCVTPPTC